MNRPARPAANLPDPTVKLTEGWHCLHLFYRVDQKALEQIGENDRAQGAGGVVANS